MSATAQAVGTFGPGFHHNEGTTKAINASHMAVLPNTGTTPSEILENTRVLIWGVKEGGSVTGDITSWAVVRPHSTTNRFPNGNVALPPLQSVTKVVLMRPGTCTHHFDMGQRYVECQVTFSSRTKVKYTAPLNRERAPQGYYMLWLLTAENVPSFAVWVYLQ